MDTREVNLMYFQAFNEDALFNVLCYNTHMKKRKRRVAGSIFSEARFIVLSTVFPSEEGVSLREIAYRSGISIGAVQAALRSVLNARMVIKSREGHRAVFRLNRSHHEYTLLETLFTVSTRRSIKEQAVKDAASNKQMLKTLTELSRFGRSLKEAARGV